MWRYYLLYRYPKSVWAYGMSKNKEQNTNNVVSQLHLLNKEIGAPCWRKFQTM